jgi:hypothetical protein
VLPILGTRFFVSIEYTLPPDSHLPIWPLWANVPMKLMINWAPVEAVKLLIFSSGLTSIKLLKWRSAKSESFKGSQLLRFAEGTDGGQEYGMMISKIFDDH